MDEHVVGEMMRPTEPFCHIIDMDNLVVEFSVPEKEVSLIEKGIKATAEIVALDNKIFDIVVSDKSIVSNPFGHTYTVKAKINLDGENVYPGMVTKIKLNTTSLSGIIVPASCVQTMPNGLAVWTVKNGRTYRKVIEVTDYVKNGVLVSKGLECGDTIVTVGYQKLYNGAKVSF